MENKEVLTEIAGKIHHQQTTDEKPISFEEAYVYLGFSKSYLYKLTHQKLIPFYKPMGKKIYFLKSELKNWVLQSRVKTLAELEGSSINYLTNSSCTQKGRN